MSAGLQSVPDELLEAARVDGAGAWSRFWHVTLPMLSPTIFFAVVVGSIFAFQTFGQIDLLTQGGPLKKTNVLTYFIYTDAARRTTTARRRCSRSRCSSITLVLTLRRRSGSSSGGCTMSVDGDAAIGARSRAPDRWAKVGRYALLTVLAFIVIFPIYITVVNSLLTPSADHRAAADVLPERPAVEHATATRGARGHMAAYLMNSFIVTIDHHRRAGASPRSSPATRSRSSSSRSSARCSSCSSPR